MIARRLDFALAASLSGLACGTDPASPVEYETQTASDTRATLDTSGPDDETSETTQTESSDSSNPTDSSGDTETSGGTDTTDGGTECEAGQLDCACSDGACVDGLACIDARCQPCPANEDLCLGQCTDLGVNDFNCGSCGSKCTVLFHAGHCDSGECLPTWSECLDAQTPSSCAEVCGNIGELCVEAGCLGNTVTVSPTFGNCEAGFVVDMGPTPCDQPIEPVEGFYRCCCTQ